MAVDKLVDSAQLNSDLTSVANAIRAKSGGSGSLSFPSGFISEIGNIPSGGGGGGGGGSVSESALNFFDTDGNIVESYSKAEALALESLPENPTKTGLVPQGWNWTLADIKDYYTSCPDGIINVGQMYTTDDGKTRIYIHLEEERKSPVLGICPYGTVYVDWGDGTDNSSLTGLSVSSTKYTEPHEYAHGGDYVISLSTTGTIGFAGAQSNNVYSYLIRGASTSNPSNAYYANSIRRIELSNNVVNFGSYSFYGCNRLEYVTIPNSITSIRNYAFYYCYSIKTITIPNSIITNNSNFGSAFYSCMNAKFISVPNELKKVDQNMYAYCRSIRSITIPNGVTSISNNAFSYTYLTKTVALPNSVTSIGSDAYSNCPLLKEVTISDNIISLGNNVFSTCDLITELICPDSISTLGSSVVNKCTNLKYLKLPNGITQINNNLCASCGCLENVIIPDTVTTISRSAFIYCKSLTKIIVPSGVTAIDAQAFSGCVGVKEYHFLSITPPTLSQSNAFDSISSDCVMYVPVGSLEAYQTATNWSTYASYMQEEPQ